MYPLSFREFLKIHCVEIKLTGDLDADMGRASMRENEVKQTFEKYLKTGGFPLAINDAPRAEEDTIRAFEGEILRARKNISLVREVLASVFEKAPSPVSYSTISKDTSGYSYKTVADYLELLKGLLILDLANYRRNGKTAYKKEKKVFFLDPFMANVLSLWSGKNFWRAPFTSGWFSRTC
ncbi:MAG: hypothetical protein QXG38_01715 [Candidatus Hadarchaeales archaeon]